jgi:anti-sigma B factor antagonist
VTVQERAIGDVTILIVEGRMTADAPHDERVAGTVRSLLKRGRKQIVLDLARVSHIDSTGLCDIVMAYTTTIRRDGWLKLLHPTARVRDLLTITKLRTILETYDSEADALASFASHPPI